MVNSQDLLNVLDDFDRSPESVGHSLRLDLADIISRNLKKKGWTQKQLAEAAGMKEPFITRIVHSASNCTFDVAGRLLFALAVRVHLGETADRPATQLPAKPVMTATPLTFIRSETTYGKKEKTITGSTSSSASIAAQAGSDPVGILGTTALG